MRGAQKFRRNALLGAVLSILLVGCGDKQPEEEFPAITYEPDNEQNHIKDGVLTSEPYEIKDEG
jgi:hypothetical protein